MAPPRRRETDVSFKAQLKEWGGLIAAGTTLLGAILFVFIALGGQYILPNDRTAKVEATVESNTKRIDALEDRLKDNNRLLLDSITKLNNRTQARLDLLTISKCREPAVWPQRLRAVCDTISDAIPLPR